MESLLAQARLNQAKIILLLQESGRKVLTPRDLMGILSVHKDYKENTVNKIAYRLARSGILRKMAKGKYAFSLNPPDDFLSANFLYSPSYISLESALSFYGIISQFPQRITSITTRKSRGLNYGTKDFIYHHFSPKLFYGYEKVGDFLMAAPEKALFDFLYLAAKGLKRFSFEEQELNLTKVNLPVLAEYCKKHHLANLPEILKI